MADIKLQLNGLNNVLNSLFRKGEDVKRAQSEAVKTVAIRLRDEATELSKGGHPDYPNVQSGRLSNSFRYEMEEGEKAIAHVGSEMDYAIYVEFGHMSLTFGHEPWHYVPAYPFFRPAIVNVFDSGDAEAIFEQTFKDALNK